MTLRAHLRRRIALSGPISIADYMADCLLHPAFGYYTTRDPLGRGGDFITAPEISQMFGELMGLALAQCWLDQGRPPCFTLAELGPGRGTLMSDVLRAAAKVPGFVQAAQIYLVELSPALRERQKAALKVFSPSWVSSAGDLPQQPLYLLANEFFDALPIRQFQRADPGWRERRVGVEGEALVIGLDDPTAPPFLAEREADTRPGDIVEHCASAAPVIDALATRIAAHGGAALIVDYGDWRTLGDTLQSVRNHKSVPVLANPGDADLTAHVDFEALADAARLAGAAHTRLARQGIFLERLGITTRAQALAGKAPPAMAQEIKAQHHRLTHADEMGNLFKVIGLYPPGAAAPPGLEP